MLKDSPKLSIVIPAYNEEAHLGDTIASVHSALERSPIAAFEVIVSDDDSDDRTAEIAESHGVRVVRSGKRNIGATRNVGAGAASGEYLLFLDADTQIDADLLHLLHREMEKGTVGGGARIEWSEPVSWKGRLPLGFWNFVSPLFRMPAGSFFFAKRSVFEQVGGFNEALFAAEELDLAAKLKRHGRLTILSAAVRTSPRKLKQFSKGEILSFYGRAALSPRKILRDRSRLDIWYTRRG